MSSSVASVVARIGIAMAGAMLASTAFGTLTADQPAATAAAPPPASPPANDHPPAAASGDADKLAKGKDLFGNWSCGSCHSLADAGATGHVGPSFDKNASLTEPFAINRITNGQGAMPAFGGQMTDEEIAQVAFYITHAAAK